MQEPKFSRRLAKLFDENAFLELPEKIFDLQDIFSKYDSFDDLPEKLKEKILKAEEYVKVVDNQNYRLLNIFGLILSKSIKEEKI